MQSMYLVLFYAFGISQCPLEAYITVEDMVYSLHAY